MSRDANRCSNLVATAGWRERGPDIHSKWIKALPSTASATRNSSSSLFEANDLSRWRMLEAALVAECFCPPAGPAGVSCACPVSRCHPVISRLDWRRLITAAIAYMSTTDPRHPLLQELHVEDVLPVGPQQPVHGPGESRRQAPPTNAPSLRQLGVQVTVAARRRARRRSRRRSTGSGAKAREAVRNSRYRVAGWRGRTVSNSSPTPFIPTSAMNAVITIGRAPRRSGLNPGVAEHALDGRAPRM